MVAKTSSFLALFNSLVSFAAAADRRYDYVIAGGGTAGLALANRLSVGDFTVAVIEAGGYYDEIFPEIAIPGQDGHAVSMDPGVTSPIDWELVTEPQTALNNRRLHYARGKVVGGSSARNFLVYQRGTKGSYDHWADDVGDQSWSWDNLFPYFKKSVSYTPPAKKPEMANATTLYEESAFSPKGGPLQVSYPVTTGPLFTWLAKIMAENGMPPTKDFNSGELYGYKYVENMIDPVTHLRSSAASSFLATAAGKIDVFTFSIAEKVLLNDEKEAIGVQVNGTSIFANKEVILSAGAIQSPQLLMLSGIGPSSELKRHGIAVIVDLPGVGQNMWDHPSFGLSTGVNLENAITKEGMAQAEAMWNANRNGPWSSSNVDAIGFTNFPEDIRKSMSPETIKELDSFPSDWPDIEQFGSPAYAGNQSGFAAPPDPTKNYASTTYILIKTVSRGTITLNSADPNDLPKLDPGYLTHPADKEIALATFKFGRRVLHSDAFKPLLSDPDVPEVFPGPSVSTDEEILGWIAEQASHVWHAAGTCKMGKEEDKMAVVDSKARVRRVKNLRVVDASIFPLLPPGHLTATVYVVAEKIAEDMLNDAKSDHVDKSEL